MDSCFYLMVFLCWTVDSVKHRRFMLVGGFVEEGVVGELVHMSHSTVRGESRVERQQGMGAGDRLQLSNLELQWLVRLDTLGSTSLGVSPMCSEQCMLV
jgi:hypothetical protein